MELYHYTAHEVLDRILHEGLSRGEVPLGPTCCLNAVWLTSDPSPEGHGLSGSRRVTRRERQIYEKVFRRSVPPDACFANKRAVRITVGLDGRDKSLFSWLPWAGTRLDPRWNATLTATGGGLAKARTWFICFRTIRPSEFVNVEILEPAEVNSLADRFAGKAANDSGSTRFGLKAGLRRPEARETNPSDGAKERRSPRARVLAAEEIEAALRAACSVGTRRRAEAAAEPARE